MVLANKLKEQMLLNEYPAFVLLALPCALLQEVKIAASCSDPPHDSTEHPGSNDLWNAYANASASNFSSEVVSSTTACSHDEAHACDSRSRGAHLPGPAEGVQSQGARLQEDPRGAQE